MITKTGVAIASEQDVNHGSSIGGHIVKGLGLAGAAHVAQNAAAHLLSKNPAIHRMMLRRFLSGGAQLPGKHGIREGLISAFVPEIKIMGNEVGKLGGEFRNILAKQGINLDSMDPRQYALLSKIVRGEFNNAMANDQGRQMAAAYIAAHMPKGGDFEGIRSLLTDPARKEQATKFLAEVQESFKKNKLLGNLGAGMANEAAKSGAVDSMMRDIIAQRSAARARGLTGADVEALANIGIGAFVDPFIPVINGMKRLASSQYPKIFAEEGARLGGAMGTILSVPKWMSDKATKFMVTDPIKNAVIRGFEGRGYMPGVTSTGQLQNISGIRRRLANAGSSAMRIFDRYGSNFVAQGAKEFAGDVGTAMRNAGLTQQDVQGIRNAYNKYQSVRSMSRKPIDAFNNAVNNAKNYMGNQFYNYANRVADARYGT